MRCFIGIDLGSTTTKAVVLGEDGAVLGRGITNSRSDYDVACQVALAEALIDTRFSLVAGELERAAPAADAARRARGRPRGHPGGHGVRGGRALRSRQPGAPAFAGLRLTHRLVFAATRKVRVRRAG